MGTPEVSVVLKSMKHVSPGLVSEQNALASLQEELPLQSTVDPDGKIIVVFWHVESPSQTNFTGSPSRVITSPSHELFSLHSTVLDLEGSGGPVSTVIS